MRVAVLTLASAIALVLAGTGSLSSGRDDLGSERPIEAFSRSGTSGSETILFRAERDPGVSLAVSVGVPGLDAEDVATARVVFKRDGEAVVGVPLGANEGQDGFTLQGYAPDAGEWDTALVLVERSNRALLVKEFEKAGIDLPIPDGTLPLPKPPASGAVVRPLNGPERLGVALELVVKEALLLPEPVQRFLFGSD